MSLRGISLLDAEPELARGIPREQLALARRLAMVPAVDVEPGPWRPEATSEQGRHTFALLVLEGLLTCSIAIADRTADDLFGPGDVLPPVTASEGLVPAHIRWEAGAPTVVAILDDRTLVAGRRWPTITRELYARVARQTTRVAVHAAIAQMPRVETRVLAVMWHLADRFGRVTPEGIVVPIKLTHEALGRLAGAQRPTVTLALRDLVDTGALEKRSDGAWLLRDGSQLELVPPTDVGGGMPSLLPITQTHDVTREVVAEPPAVDFAPLRRRLDHLRRGYDTRRETTERLLVDCRKVSSSSRELRMRLAAARESQPAD